MKDKCKVCSVMCDISRGNELRACAFEHNGDENICPFDARYLDLSEHDKQIRVNVIDEFVRECLGYEDLTFENAHIERLKKIAEQLKGEQRCHISQ